MTKEQLITKLVADMAIADYKSELARKRSEQARKAGQAGTGKSKRRGGSAYYRNLRKMRDRKGRA
jgi:hypothetical protein